MRGGRDDRDRDRDRDHDLDLDLDRDRDRDRGPEARVGQVRVHAEREKSAPPSSGERRGQRRASRFSR
jgi:hypothetical protein